MYRDIQALEQYVYHRDFLITNDGHEVYHEIFGNSDGTPILFIHGGPGLGCTPFDRRFFNPQKHKVLFIDQRGAGKSLPEYKLEHNTTQHLLDDMWTILDNNGFDHFHIFAGSWGSTLACLLAIAQPERIKSMILRGYFPGTARAKKFLEEGGTGLFFPEAWARINALVPVENQSNPSQYFLDQLLHAPKERQLELAEALVYFNVATAKIGISEEEIQAITQTGNIIGKAVIQSYYSANNFFLEDDYIITNVHKFMHIQTVLIHGRYDMICPPSNAFELYQKLENAKLHLVHGGHLSAEPEIESLLLQYTSAL